MGRVLQPNNMSAPRFMGDFTPFLHLHGGTCHGDNVIWGCRAGCGRMQHRGHLLSTPQYPPPPKTPVCGGGLMLISFPDRIMRVV